MYSKISLFLLSVVFILSCQQPGQKPSTAVVSTNDSSKMLEIDTGIPPVTLLLPDTLSMPEDDLSTKITGKHKLTLQWISWDKPGQVTISKGADEWLAIKGEQKNSEGAYVKIEGRIKPLSPEELRFDGTIEYMEKGLNNGKPCLKIGEQTFLSTKNRKYWRLQNMVNCDGITTDYIDIYF